MAENTNQDSSSSLNIKSNMFQKGMYKDLNDTFIGDGLYTHARNAVSNTHEGQTGTFTNEPSNLYCIDLPYTLIGAINIGDDNWVLFTTDDTNSEIGIFDESACSYTTIVNDSCLNFKKSYLITGAFRERYDCQRAIYWDDGLNPSRVLNIDNVPWIQDCTTDPQGCITCVDTDSLDCEKIRIAPLIKHPCIELKKGKFSGTLPNGSYQVAIAYTIDGVKVSDYIGLTEVQSLFDHNNTASSLEVIISDIDKTFDEFELVLVSNINAQSTAQKVGYYSTSQGIIYIDRIDPERVNVPISQVVFRSEPIEKTDAMYPVNNYLLRVGTTSRFKFNYQPLANNINVNWVCVEYPADYYVKGGNNTSYLRDEQYSFFIRWIYNTGERSESYHIPGRAALPSDLTPQPGSTGDVYETTAQPKWKVQNTAIVDSTSSYILSDGGVVIAKGRMAYWESTEKYPDNRPDIWGNLCALNIRHHKMPDETVDTKLHIYADSPISKIRLLGVEFDNIQHPVDNDNVPIASIVGYEILRGSREGNKTIVAKGLLSNLREYDIPGNPSVKGLYQNYPYNSLENDNFLTSDVGLVVTGSDSDNLASPLTVYKNDMFSFHSPDTTFNNPYLNANEIKIYTENQGDGEGYVLEAHKHPRHKMLRGVADIVSKVIGVVSAANMFSTGVTIDATEDIPIKLQVGPPGPFPGSPPTGGHWSGLWTWVIAWATYIAQVGIWLLNLAATITMIGIVSQALTAKILELFLKIAPKVQFGHQVNSSGFYNKTVTSPTGQRRRAIDTFTYVKSSIQSFTKTHNINNLNRGQFVAVELSSSVANPSLTDTSLSVTFNNRGSLISRFKYKISSHYASLKIPIPSQYGQLDQIKQLPISNCVTYTQPTLLSRSKTTVIFNGDVYINRHTEKNQFLYFTTWLMGEPDLTDFNYRNHINIPYPRYWIDSSNDVLTIFENSDDYRRITSAQANVLNLWLKSGRFFLSNNGIRDFYVESEVNEAYRDWEDVIEKRHYDIYAFTDIDSMFRSDVIRNTNYFKYDYSLSLTKLFNSSITWGEILPRTYDPFVAENCFVYRPNRVIYSLPQQDESKSDSWRNYLVNNYQDFESPVTSIKPINKTGALFVMRRESPKNFLGQEEIKLDATATKVLIGDGGLFSQPLQNLSNADVSLEYGSCQNRQCVLNTPYGVFWVSQNQGKVFQYAGQVKEISKNGMKWWFAKYLPSRLLTLYPDFRLYDNPVKGVGVQAIYDNIYELVYFTKKDYIPKVQGITLDSDNETFLYNGSPISLTDSNYFEDISWTISYDVKIEAWLSFHDWKPTQLIPSKTSFMSVNGDSIWKHHSRCDSYCNFYGVDYPFEIEFVSATGPQVNSLRSIEYYLEVYNNYNNCRDKLHILDENFDQAIIYNSEQISGMLNLQVKPKNNPLALIAQPNINLNSIDIYCSKEEQKYRFNQFWDITKNRGEFIASSTPMFISSDNGYEREINSAYVSYNKNPLERKKFRHNVNKVFLRKKISGNNNFLFKFSYEKLLNSPR
jgi:hypothetical protein